MPAVGLLLLLGVAMSFTLAVSLDPWFQSGDNQRFRKDSVMEILLGEGRRLFANHFYATADVYFHSGNYPTIFDQSLLAEERHMENIHGAATDHDHEGHDHAADTSDLPPSTTQVPTPVAKRVNDWISRLGEHLKPDRHVHLEKGEDVREILPWLRMAANLDPHKSETYTVAAYWLRTVLKKPQEAEDFLREGWRANPDSYEILFELGRVFEENRQDPERARNLWELAWRKWQEKASPNSHDDQFIGSEILGHLAQLEMSQKNWARAIEHFTALLPLSSDPKAVQAWIDEIKPKLNSPTGPANPSHQ